MQTQQKRRNLVVHWREAKERRQHEKPLDGAGDTWTWTALTATAKLIISWLVGGRDGEYALAFMDDVRDRLANRVQLTTDGHRAYLNAVEYLRLNLALIRSRGT